MRARLALAASGVALELREILLKNKPQAMLQISPKSTVPVLQLANAQVMEESIEIMLWALRQNDPLELLPAKHSKIMMNLIDVNDFEFKSKLDKYKYSDRHPQKSRLAYRQDCEFFLQSLDNRLTEQAFLMANSLSLADLAIFPFIRQFAAVDQQWFDCCPYKALRKWLTKQMESNLFGLIMKKYKPWVVPQMPLIVF